jgi:hypothetical protein
VLLAGAFVLPASFLGRKSGTFDELAHLPAGYSYWATHEIRLNPMHPPLVKELCALPLLLMDVRLPADAASIRGSTVDPLYQWEFGRRFFAANDPVRMLFWGRLPAVLLSLALALLVYAWAGELWGAGGGLLALFLYVFDPSVTAHAQLVATDVGLALFATLFVFTLRKALARPTAASVTAAGAALGLALATKFSALALLPTALVLVAIDRWQRGGEAAPRWKSLAGVLLAAAVACVVLWATYFFPADPFFYWRGFHDVYVDQRPGYFPVLLGDFRPAGPHHLLVAWLVKTPLPVLILFAGAAVAAFRGRSRGLREEAFLLVPALALFAVNAFFSAALGVRYLIPVFPFLFVFTGRLGTILETGSRRTGLAIAALLAWAVVEFVAISPDHLSYFNQIAGGPRGGVRWLDDSNVDWGQGLVQLRDYLEQHPAPGARLCYFGTFDPRSFGVFLPELEPEQLISPRPGTLILSAHCVARTLAWANHTGDGRAAWLRAAEPKAIVGHAYWVYEIAPG